MVFALTLLSGVSSHAIGSTSVKRKKLHLGDGIIAAIAEGDIVTFEQLRKSVDPIIPKLHTQAKYESEFSSINRPSK